MDSVFCGVESSGRNCVVNLQVLFPAWYVLGLIDADRPRRRVVRSGG